MTTTRQVIPNNDPNQVMAIPLFDPDNKDSVYDLLLLPIVAWVIEMHTYEPNNWGAQDWDCTATPITSFKDASSDDAPQAVFHLTTEVWAIHETSHGIGRASLMNFLERHNKIA